MYVIPRAYPVDSIESSNKLPIVSPLGIYNGVVPNIKIDLKISRLQELTLSIEHNQIPFYIENSPQLLKSLKELQALQDIDIVKEQIAKQIIYFMTNRDQEPILHTILTGPDNGNKFAVASCLAEIWSSIGIIPNNSLKVMNRDNFIAKYVGWTETKTRNVLQDNINSVIYIEEAYNLCNGNHDSFGRDAIYTINEYLSNNNTPVIIMDNPRLEYFPQLRRKFQWNFNFDKNSDIKILRLNINHNRQLSEPELSRIEEID